MSKRSKVNVALVAGAAGLLVATTLTTVPAQAAASKVLVSDDFSRSVATGFGSADVGGSYSLPNANNTRVDDSKAIFGLTGSVSRIGHVGPSDVPDIESVNSFGVSALPTSGSVYLAQVLRSAPNGSRLETRLRITTNKKVSLGFRAVNAAGSASFVGSDVALPFDMAADTRIMVRSQVEGSTLRTKAWPKGTSEPTNWMVTTSTDANPDAGRSGVWAYLGSGTNPIDVSIDDLKLSSLATPNELPAADFTQSVDDLDVDFDASGSSDADGTIARYDWDFGDGSTGTGKSPSKKYAAAGTYPVKLTVTDDEDGKNSISKSVTTVAPGLGSAMVFPLTASVSQMELVEPSDTADIETVNSFGVSALPTSGSVYLAQVLRSAPNGSRLETRLRITTNKKVSLGFRAVNAASSSSFVGSDVALPFDMAADTRIMVRSQVEGSTLRAKAWPKGTSEPANWMVTTSTDANPDAGRSGVWAYLGSGTNPIDVLIDDFKVTAIETPNVLPTATFTQTVADLDVAFDAADSSDADGSIASYGWDFGDGSTGAGKAPNKKYAAPGTYVVKLTVTDDEGGESSVTKNITVVAPNAAPTAAFTETVADLTVAFDASGSADSDGALESYAWNFGDGSTGTGKDATKTYASAGTYDVTLTVTDDRGGKANVTRQVTAIAPNVAPVAAFTESVSDLDLAVDASGSVDSDGTVVGYDWDFGDGSTATGKTATKKYSTAGVYNVKLTVVDNRGGNGTVTRQVTAIAPNVLPTAAFTESIDDLDVSFDAGPSTDSDGTLTDYAWDFGDGSTGSGKTATKKYAAAGPYAVKLTVTDNRGGTATVTREVTAIAPNVLPAAVFAESVNDLTVAFDAAGSVDSDGTITAYSWDYGDGSTGTGKTATKVYSSAGNYNVTLTVTDNRGGTASVSRQVTAIAPNVLPTAAFVEGVNDLSVSFDAGSSTDSDGTITAYEWDFGDGTTGTGSTASRTYAAAGNYDVKLTVTDNRGGQATVTRSVTAIAPNVLPAAAFAENIDNLAVSFDAAGSSDSDGVIDNYAWEYGDGAVGTGQTSTHTYAAAGTYSVKLTVTDNRGGTSSVTRQVTVVAANVLPTAAFTHAVTDLAVAFDAASSTDSDGTISSYVWEYGDGETGNGKTSNRTYAAAGNYNVKLTITDDRGGTATVTRQVTATAPAPSKPSAANTGVPAGTPLTVYNGSLTITTPGTVIDGMDIHGYVAIKAPNVTIKRSIIRGGAAATVNRALLAATQAGAGNFLIEDVTITPKNPTPYVNGINVNQSGTIRRADISGTVDGIMIYGSGVRVENSYLHDFAHYLNDPNWGGGPSHDDAIQVQAGNGIQIVGNSLSGAYNAAVMVTQDAGTTSNLAIEGNWLDYGGCSINFGSNGSYKTGMQVKNNRFGRAQRNTGCAVIHNSAKSDLVPTGNIWDDNSQAISVSRGS